MSLLLALPKGRLGDDLVAKLRGSALALDEAALKSRALRIPTATPSVQALLLKGADIARYVAAGIAAFGITGSDTLDESSEDLLELADLRFGHCRLSLCVSMGTSVADLRRRPHLRLATKFPKATAAWLAKEGITAELVPLASSVELAPILGLADAIVDLVQTGGTLQAHGLQELRVLGHTSARLVANRAGWLAEAKLARPIVSTLVAALQER